MALSIDDIELKHRVIDGQHIFTSPDVPGLHVSNGDESRAYASIQSALDMIDRMHKRLEARQQVHEVQRERIYA